MLAITAKVRLLKEEVASARSICEDLIGTLEQVSDDTDYRKKIGIFAVQAPEWKILVDEKRKFKDLIRQVCTGELSSHDAEALICHALSELDRLDTWLQVPKK